MTTTRTESLRTGKSGAGSNMTAPTQFIETALETYAYRRFGTGSAPPLVLLQHFTGTLDNWDPAVTDPLAPGREVILFESAGVGRSTGEVPNTHRWYGQARTGVPGGARPLPGRRAAERDAADLPRRQPWLVVPVSRFVRHPGSLVSGQRTQIAIRSLLGGRLPAECAAGTAADRCRLRTTWISAGYGRGVGGWLRLR